MSTSNTPAQPPVHPFFQPRRPHYTTLSSISSPKPDPLTTIKHVPQPAPQSSPQLLAKSKPSRLPPQASIAFVEKDHIEPLRRINSLLLPISYPDSFYRKALAPDGPVSFSRVILWTDAAASEAKVIGGIVCRLDPALAPDAVPEAPVPQPGLYDIYIQSLTLLSPYRGKGLVAEVLEQVIEAAITHGGVEIKSLYAHVWTHNEEALQWYSARGFQREEPVINGYYRRLKPDTAWIFRRKITPSDHLQHFSTPGKQGSQNQPPRSSPSTVALPPVAGDYSDNPSNARSFQDRGPEREWNDLPDDVLSNPLLKPSSRLASTSGSTASSRSSSRSATDRGKKKRVYPTAAYSS